MRDHDRTVQIWIENNFLLIPRLPFLVFLTSTHVDIGLGNKVWERWKREPVFMTDYVRMERKGENHKAFSLTMTLCCPVRLGGSQRSCVSDTVTAHGVSPISTV